MEPVTHFLTGAAIGRAGFQRKSAYAVLAATLAAEAADLDMLWSFGGPVCGLQHHRGITHTFVAVPVIAAVVCGAVWLLDRVWLGRHRQDAIRWPWVYAAALVAALSHLLLDWTNNYGVRPFFPWNPHWYAGSIVFIAEPVLWLVLLSAVIVPWLLGLADREIGAKRKRSHGQGWAVFALLAMVAVWSLRWFERERALELTTQEAITATTSREPVLRMTAEPYPVNPFEWHMIVETAHTWQTADADTWTGVVTPGDVLHKPPVTAAVLRAERSYLGRVYLDWAAPATGWPVVADLGPAPVAGHAGPAVIGPERWTTVEFRDLRFEYSFLHKPGVPTLGGWVYVVDGAQIAGEFLGGREQK